MVSVVGSGDSVEVTATVMAGFVLALQFQSCVVDAVLCQLLSDQFLDLVAVTIAADVHRCAMAEPIQTANVDVVDFQHALNF